MQQFPNKIYNFSSSPEVKLVDRQTGARSRSPRGAVAADLRFPSPATKDLGRADRGALRRGYDRSSAAPDRPVRVPGGIADVADGACGIREDRRAVRKPDWEFVFE